MKDELTHQVIGAAMAVHRELGPGFLESVYQKALAIELASLGLDVVIEKRIEVMYRGRVVGDFKADLFVENRLIVELKATECLAPIHEVQTVNYLNATGHDIGLLINFGSQSLQFKRKFRNGKTENPEIL
ncbi:MAG: GxxExxY protein [Verrucomicrobiae bacterium]|nr:GxxExxY protein [Verrucomicrobiae bacterium]